VPGDPSKGYYPPEVTDPTSDTTITYVVDGQVLNVVFRAGDTVLSNKDGEDSVEFTGPSAMPVNYAGLNKVVEGYYMTTDGTTDASNAKFDEDDNKNQEVVIQYAQMGAYTPKYDETPADPNAPKLPDPIVYPNDPDDPTKPSETTPVIPHLPGYTPAGPDGQPLDPVDPDDPTKGYVPPAADPENPGADIDITYVADAQKMLVRFYDAKDTSETPTELKQTITLDGQSYETVDYTVDGEAIDKLVPGYVLVSDEIVDKATDDSIAKYDNDKSVNQEAILLYDKLGSVEFKVDTTEDGNTETPDVPSDFVYPNDPDDVSKTLDPQDPDYPLTKDGDPVVPYIPGYTPTLDDGTELTPIDSTDPEKGYYPPAVPSDPTASTTVTYKQDAAAVQVDLVDQDGNAVPDHTASYTIDGKTNDKVDYSSVDKVVKGYFMTSDDTTTDAFKYYDDAADDSEPSQKALIKYDVLGSYDFTVTPPDDTDESYTPPVTPDDIQYTNDPDDPKLPMDPSNPDYPTSGNVPYVPGYTPEGPDGQPLTPISNNPEDGYLPPAPDPENPGADIKINYVADDQKVNVSYWLEDDTTQINDKKVVSYEGKTGQSIGYKDLNKSLKGYILKTDGTETTVSYDNLDGDQEVHLNYAVLGNYDFEITPPDEATTPPKVPVDSIQYPNDPDDPTVPYDSSDVDYPDDPDAVIVPDVPGYTPEGPDGAPLVPVDPTDPSKGWLPPLPEDPTKDTTVTYVANDQNVKVQLVDEDGNLLDVEGVTPEYPITGKTGTKIDYSSVDKVVPGYYIDTDDTTTVTTFDDSAKDQIVKITYKELGQFTPSSDEPSFPGVPEDAVGEDGNIDYPGNPQDPTKAWNGDNGDYDDTDDTDDNVPVIPYIPGFTPRDPSTNQPLTPVDSDDPTKGYLPPAVDDPSGETKINYTAWAQVLDVNLYEEGTTKYVTNTDSLDSYALTGKSLAEVDYSSINKVVPGYVLVDDETVSSHDNFIEKFDDTDNTQQAAVQARRALRAATSVDDTEHQEANIYYATVGSYEFTVDPGDDATPPTPPTDIAYPNDLDDPEKVDVTNVVIPPVDGYTPTTEDGTPLTPIKDEDGNVTGYEPPVPADPTTPTPITYQPDTQEAQVRLVDGDGNELKTPIDFSGKTGTPIDLEKVEDSDKVVPGYYIVDDGTKTPTNFDNQTDVTQYVDVVYGELKDFTPTSDDPNFPGSTDPIPYPGSETDPKVPWDDTNVPNIPYVPGYTPTDPSGQPLTPVDPDDPTKGYNPPTPASPGQSTVINYVAGTQTVNVKFLDNKGNEVQGAFSEDGTSLADITWDGMNKVVTGYIMQSDETLGVDKFDDTDNLPGEADKTPQNYVVTYAKAGRWVPEITPGDNTNPPKVPGAIDYPNDPSDPEGIDPSDVVVPYVPGYTPTTDDGTPLTPVDPEDPSKGYLPPDVTDPTKDTTITYNEAPQNLTVRFVDANGKSLANASGVKSTMMSGLSDSEVDYSGVNKVVPGYYLVTDGSLDMTHYDNLSDVDQLVDLVYAQLGGIRPGSDDPDFPGVPDIQWPGDPNDPSAPFDPENPPVIPYVPGYTPVDGDGNPLDPVDPDDPEAGYKVPNVDDPSDWLKINYTKDPDMDISSNLENSEPVEGPEKAEKESKKSPEAKAPVEEAAAPSPAVSSTTPLRVATPVPVAYPIVPNESSVSNAALPETGDEQATMGLVGLALVGIVAMLKRRKKKGISFALVNGSTTTKHWKR
jgi:LPXTG-motif cell wall-anchored protein